MTGHPNALRLEALAAGDSDDGAASHVSACAACSGYVQRLRREASQFAASGPPAAEFLAGVRLRAEHSADRPAPRARWPRVTWAVPLLAAAAAVALFVRMRHDIDPTGKTAGSAPVGSEHTTTRFKGALPIAVIREREGRQERLTTSVDVTAHDALRLELAVDVKRTLTAGLLSDDGSYLELLAPTQLEPGTHLSEQAARFDAHPSAGWLIAGEPADVARARRGQRDRVSALRVNVTP
jgi:hypothetical protein